MSEFWKGFHGVYNSEPFGSFVAIVVLPMLLFVLVTMIWTRTSTGKWPWSKS